MEPKPTNRRVPLGKPLERTDEDLERLAEITPEDVEDARLWAKRHDDELGGLIEATPEDDQ